MQHSTKIAKTTTNKQRRNFNKRTGNTDSAYYSSKQGTATHNLTSEQAEYEAQQAFHEAQQRTTKNFKANY